MIPNDSDWELLESRLDGALAPEEDSALSLRLTNEPELTRALESLRQERGIRQTFFASLEPATAEADAWIERVCAAASAARRAQPPVWAARGRRWLTAVAACLLIGFLSGWLGRGRLGNFFTRPDSPMALGKPGQPVISYSVPLTDDAGRVIAVQNFDTLEKAQDFARSVQRWQDKREQLHNGAVPMAEAQF